MIDEVETVEKSTIKSNKRTEKKRKNDQIELKKCRSWIVEGGGASSGSLTLILLCLHKSHKSHKSIAAAIITRSLSSGVGRKSKFKNE